MERRFERNVTGMPCQREATADSADALSSILQPAPLERERSGKSVLSEAHLRELYQDLPYAVIVTDAGGTIVSVNRAACCILCRPENQLLGLRGSDLALSNDLGMESMDAQCRGGGEGGSCEVKLLRGNGSSFEADAALINMHAASPALMSLVFRDITKRKCAEAKAKEQAEWLDKANEAIFVSDPGHRIVYWNKGAERMLRWTAEEVVGQTIATLASRAGIGDDTGLEAAARFVDWRGTVSLRGRDGAPQILAVSVTVLRDEHGGVTGQLFIASDITEYSRLQDKYERSQRLQSVGMLAAGVAHDLNNLLTPISVGASLLRGNLSEPDDLRLLDTMLSSVARATSVVRQILGFTKGMGGQPQLIQVKHVLREVADIIQETFPRSIEIEELIPADLWPVLANPTQLHQVLLNLCVNARDAMPGGGCLRLGARNCHLDADAALPVEGARSGAWLVMFVQDSGMGIAAEILAHIWTPFFTTKPRNEGTGLGLSTVRDIVESHGGFVTVDSSVGKGSTFQVFLPATSSSQSEEVGGAAEIAGRGRGEVILLVDDEVAVRESATALLTKAGYHVATAIDGSSAITAVRACPNGFHLMLTDLDLPGMGGVRLAETVNAIRPTLPIIAMTGMQDATAVGGVRPFAGGFLAKPFSGEELLYAVRGVLERAGNTQTEVHLQSGRSRADASAAEP